MRPAYQELYAAHLFTLQQRTKAVLARENLDALVIHSCLLYTSDAADE